MDTYIKDKYNKPIGYLREMSGQIMAFHMTKGYLGYYMKNTDITFSAKGGIYCYGNGLTDMIREAERNK